MIIPRKTKLIIKKWLSAGFLTVMIFSMMPQSIRKTIEKDVFAETLNNPRIVQDSFMDAGQKVTWDCIYFGSYPQTEIVDTPKTSGVYGNSWVENGDYEVDPITYEKLKNETNWDDSGDTVIDGKKYRRISRDDVKVICNYHWNIYIEYHYFRYDKIKWRVLNTNENKVFLLADKALDSQQYNSSNADVTWARSTIRSWLNGYEAYVNACGEDYSNKNFLKDAFSAIERNSILKITVKNDNNIEENTTGGENTKDQIFLLSQSEIYTNAAKQYGFVSEKGIDDNARRCKSTTFSKGMGSYTNSDTEYLSNCYWWLRSPGNLTRRASQVLFDGSVNRYTVDVDSEDISVRPAMKIDLSSSNLWSYAGTVCSDGTVVNAENNNNQQPSQNPSQDQTSTPSQPSTEDQQKTAVSTKRANEIYASSKTIVYKSKPSYLNVKTKGNSTLSFTSSNKKVATIDKNGKITPKSYGETTISIYAQETGQYTKASKKIKITVVPQKIKLKKVTSPKKNCVQVKWGKDKTVTGYQMMFSKKKSFKNNTYTRWYKQKKNSMYGFGLGSKKTYYFKIRAYKVIGKKKLYGIWSQTKKVKIK